MSLCCIFLCGVCVIAKGAFEIDTDKFQDYNIIKQQMVGLSRHIRGSDNISELKSYYNSYRVFYKRRISEKATT